MGPFIFNGVIEGQHGDGQNPPKIFVPALVRAAKIIRALNWVGQEWAMFQKVGQRHHFRPCATNPKFTGLRLEGGNAGKWKAGQRVGVAGRKRQPGPNAAGLVFRSRFGEQFDKPLPTARRIKPDGWKIIFCILGITGINYIAGEMWLPAGGEKFLGDSTALFHSGEMRQKNTINAIGANPK